MEEIKHESKSKRKESEVSENSMLGDKKAKFKDNVKDSDLNEFDLQRIHGLSQMANAPENSQFSGQKGEDFEFLKQVHIMQQQTSKVKRVCHDIY